MAAFLYHRASGRTYQIMGAPADGQITLSDGVATFSDTYNKEAFKAQGYFPVQGEDHDEAKAAGDAKVAAEQAAQSEEDEEAA